MDKCILMAHMGGGVEILVLVLGRGPRGEGGTQYSNIYNTGEKVPVL
tara:strand:- start:4102 stop:4242 length:141 start_codon:yes stop_codon:yes gene_type:complete